LRSFGLYDKVISMTDESGGAEVLLDEVSSLRVKVRTDRHGFWFPVVLFAILTLLSAPLYWQYPASPDSMHCHTLNKFSESCSGVVHSYSAGALAPGFGTNGVGRWVSDYWALALVLGYAATVWFYRRQGDRVGVRVRTWPAVFVGVGVLVLVLVLNELDGSWDRAAGGDLWMRGTVALVILSTGILVLAILERNVWYVVFALGFVGLALLASLYNVSNLFDRFGIGGPFNGNGSEMPNIILPGVYLLLGGFLFWAVGHDAHERHHHDEIEVA
jgi:hypothetical protein